MQVDKGALLKAVKKVMPGVDKGGKVLEGAENIIFTKDGLHSFNKRISVMVPFEFDEEISGTVDATDLFNILNNKRLKVISDAIDLEALPNGLKFSGNDWSGVLDYKDDSEWMNEKLEIMSKTPVDKELPTDFMKGMGLCSIKGNPTPHHGVYIKDSGMYSTDKTVANIYSMDSACEDEFWIGQLEVDDLLKVPGVFTHYGKSENVMGHWVHFKDTEGTRFSMVLKDTSLYKNVLDFLLKQEDIEPTDKRFCGTIPVGFADAVATCSLMAEKEKKSGKKNVEITFTAQKMIVKGIKIGGKLTNHLPWDEGTEMDLGNEKLKYRFVTQNIVNASRKAKSFFINKMNDEQGTCMIVLYSEEYKTIILSLTK